MAAENDGMSPEREVKNFKFQQLSKIRVSGAHSGASTEREQLLACSSKFGITFVGSSNGFKVLRTADIIKVDEDHVRDRSTIIVDDFPFVSTVQTGYPPFCISLSCDDLTLAVISLANNNLLASFYDTRCFLSNTVPQPFTSSILRGFGVKMTSWNPALPHLMAICLSDSSVLLLNVTDKLQVAAQLPATAGATCLCWSPKGKQLVAGKLDGTLSQYDQALVEKKKWPCPNNIGPNPYKVVDVLWESTFVFVGAYLPVQPDTSDQPYIVIVNASKDGRCSFINYEDICLGTGEERQHKYYMLMIAKWEMMVFTSTNALSATIVGKNLDKKDSPTWERWNLEDSSRAEMPLADDYSDTHPVGMGIDFSQQTPVQLGDKLVHPPCPLLLLLSTDGVLLPFHMMYSHKDAPSLTAPPQPMPTAGIRLPPGDAVQQASAGMPASGPPVSRPAPSLFGSPANPSATSMSAAGFGFGAAAGVAAIGTQRSSAVVSEPPPINLHASSTSQPVSLFGQPNVSGAQVRSSGAQVRSSGPPTSTTAGSTGATSSAKPASIFGGAPSTSSPFSFIGTTQANTATAAPFTFGQLANSQGSSLFGQSEPSMAFASKPQDIAPVKSTQPVTPISSTIPRPNPGQSGTTASGAGTTGIFSTPQSTSGGLGLAKPVAQSMVPQQPPKQGPAPTQPVSLFRALAPQLPVPSQPPAQPPRQRMPTPNPAANSFPGSPSLQTSTQASDAANQRAAPVHQSTQESPTAVSAQKHSTINEAVDSEFTRSIMEEVAHFQQELRDLRTRAERTNAKVGSQEERDHLTTTTRAMYTFNEDIRDTTQTQHREIKDLKALTLDMFSLVEECRTREKCNMDSRYHHLLKSRALDPGSAEKMRQIQQQYQFLESGINNVELILDNQWDDYQNQKRNKSRRIQTPTSDSLYRVVKSNHNLILGQKKTLEGIQHTLKRLRLYNRTSNWDVDSTDLNSTSTPGQHTREISLTSLAESLLECSSYSSVQSSPSRALSILPEKEARLRDYLCRRSVSKVKSTMPANLSMSKIVSATALRKKLDQLDVSTKEHGTGLTSRTAQAPSTTSSFQSSSGCGISTRTREQTKIAPPGGSTSPVTSNGAPKASFVIGQSSSFATGSLFGQAQNSQASGFVKGNLIGQGQNSQPAMSSLTSGKAKPVIDVPQSTVSVVSGQKSSSTISSTDSFLSAKQSQSGGAFNFGGTTSTSFGGRVEEVTPPASEEDEVTVDIQDGNSDMLGQPELSEDDYDEAEEEDEVTEEENGDYQVDDALDSQDEGRTSQSENEAADSSTTQPQAFDFHDFSQSKQSTANPTPASQPSSNTPAASKPTSSVSSVSKNLFGTASSSTSSAQPTSSAGFNFSATAGTSTGFSFRGVNSTGGTTSTPPITTTTASISSTTPSTVAMSISSTATTKSTSTLSSFIFSTGAASSSSTAGSTNSGGSIFGGQSTGSTGGGFSSLFGKSTTTSLFGKPDGTVPVTSTQPATTAAVSAAQSAATTTALFGKLIETVSGTSSQMTTSAPATGSSSGLFGLSSTTTTGSIFNNTTIPVPATTAPTTTTTAAKNLFGQTPATVTANSAAGLFGQTTDPATTTITSGFGLAQIATTTAVTTATTTSTSGSRVLFGQTAAESVFGQPASTGNLFGQAQITTTTTAVTTATTTSTSGSGVLNGQTAAGSVFGQPVATSTTVPATAAPGLFGQTTSSGAGCLFGQPQTTTSSTSLFGADNQTQATSLFNQPAAATTTTTTGGGLFGTAAAKTSSAGFSFGQTAQSTSVFGQPGGFGQTATAFGAGTGATESSGFGQSTSVFGQTGSSVFGQTNPTGSSLFGQPAAPPATTTSGGGSVFGGNGEGFLGGLGDKPSTENASKNVFGGSFGATSSTPATTNLFGSQTFGTSTTTTTSGFGTGGSNVAAGGFNVTPQAQQQGAFGGAPAFGGGLQFGGSPSFGSNPSFGNSPVFGGNKPMGGSVFGGTAGSGGGAIFGSSQTPGQATSGFAGFASGNSPTFGSLAQQGGGGPTGFGEINQQQQQVSFGSPPFGSPTFGGTTGSAPAAGFGSPSFGSSPSFTGYRT